jgi:phosphate starvation-inducible PhoH-like protein
LARRQLTLENTVAAELAGSEDAVLRELEGRIGCDVHLRGNVLTLDGDEVDVQDAAAVVDELVGLIERGHDLVPTTIDTVAGAMDASRAPAEILEDVIWRHRSIKVAPKTVNQKRYVDSIRDHTVTFGIGPAGTGKTYLAVACAVEALLAERVQRLILVRPAVEAGERLGFLPGDLTQKVDPYLRPMYDALYEMMGIDRVARFIERNVIEVAPLAFMRGRSLNDSFIILDEAQNTTVEQMKMFLTRIGFGSKAVVTGDITQTDLPAGRPSGLSQVVNILREVEGVAFTFFDAKDVVRHPLVQRIVQAYESREDAK